MGSKYYGVEDHTMTTVDIVINALCLAPIGFCRAVFRHMCSQRAPQT